MITTEQYNNYLSTLTSKPVELTLDFLTEIQVKHIEQYSFNSLSVHLKEELPLAPESLYTKIVENKRGGYCFELNGLFYELLTHLGFDCSLQLARVTMNSNEPAPRTHRFTKVIIDSVPYYVDVGFGPYTPASPLRMDSDTPQIVGNTTYRIIRNHNEEYLLQCLKNDEWFTLNKSDNASYSQADCDVGHYYSYSHPNAVFVNHLVVSLKTPFSLESLRNGEFHQISESDTTVSPVISAEHLQQILRDTFSISLEEHEISHIYNSFCSKQDSI